jgi:hypothetical protein
MRAVSPLVVVHVVAPGTSVGRPGEERLRRGFCVSGPATPLERLRAWLGL